MLVECSAVAMVTPNKPQMRRKSPSAAMVAWTIRSPAGLLAAGEGDDAGAGRAVSPWAEAGSTWWLESNWKMPHHSDERMDEVRRRLVAGPPTIAT